MNNCLHQSPLFETTPTLLSATLIGKLEALYQRLDSLNLDYSINRGFYFTEAMLDAQLAGSDEELAKLYPLRRSTCNSLFTAWSF